MRLRPCARLATAARVVSPAFRLAALRLASVLVCAAAPSLRTGSAIVGRAATPARANFIRPVNHAPLPLLQLASWLRCVRGALPLVQAPQMLPTAPSATPKTAAAFAWTMRAAQTAIARRRVRSLQRVNCVAQPETACVTLMTFALETRTTAPRTPRTVKYAALPLSNVTSRSDAAVSPARRPMPFDRVQLHAAERLARANSSLSAQVGPTQRTARRRCFALRTPRADPRRNPTKCVPSKQCAQDLTPTVLRRFG
jgi:hypothetical protein